MPKETSPNPIAVHAGFPNPAADRGYAPSLSLDRLLIIHPASTYYFRIEGNTWEDQGIFDGDIAVIDRALMPRPQDLTICWRDGVFAILSASELAEGEEPWGVVGSIIHRFVRKKV